jgi:hypothetical protein
MDTLALGLLFASVVLFVVRAWKARGRLSGRDRWGLITSFVAAVTTFAIARLLVNWVSTPPALWLIAVAALTAGIVGAVLRWPALTWYDGRHPIRRAMGIGATLVTCTLMIGLAVS